MDKFNGMYFSSCFINDKAKLANYLLYYDEIHFGLPGKFDVNHWISEENLYKDAQISIIGKANEKSKIEMMIIAELIKFVKDNHLLLNDCIIYHNEIIADKIDNIVQKGFHGGIPLDEFFDVISGRDKEIEKAISYIKDFSEESEMLSYSKASALLNAEKLGYHLILEHDDDLKKYWDKMSLATNLSNLLAYDCLSLVIPSIRPSEPEDILELREKLRDQIIPFRMLMRKLSIDLRAMLSDEISINKLKKESLFIIETQVQPAIEELKRRIQLENSNLFNKMFGKIISWIPLFAQLYIAPSPERFFKIVGKIGSDSSDLLNDINNDPLLKEPGIGFLLGVEEFGGKILKKQ